MPDFLEELGSAIFGGFEADLMRTARRLAGPTRYAAGTGSQGILQQLISLFTGNRGGSKIDAAKRLLESAGYRVTQRGKLEPIGRRPQLPPSGRFDNPFSTRPAQPKPGRTIEERAPDGAPAIDDELGSYGTETLTPQSSNVFAFSFVRESRTRGVLYVTYKANRISSEHTHRGAGRLGGREQLHGKLGKTVGGKTNERGSMYGYFDVPVVVYERMKRASSKGKFVWDELRQRGTIYGHQYSYKLVQGQIATNTGQQYIPRRATNRGFAIRSLRDVGRGRAGYISSTLPAQRGFATRNSLQRL